MATAKKSVASSTKSTKSTKKKQVASAEEVDDFEEWKKAKQLAVPKDQLELCDAELKEVIPRVLQAINPEPPDSLVTFNFKEGKFVPIPVHPCMVTVYSQLGTYLHKDTDEARKQLLALGYQPTDFAAAVESQLSIMAEEDGKEEGDEEVQAEEQDERGEDEGGEGEDEGGEGEGVAKEEEEEEEANKAAAGGSRKKKLTNQFNFCERASLTYNNPFRPRSTQTTPPPMNKFSTYVNQWIIYDGYMQDFEEQEEAKERERLLREKDMIPVVKRPTAPKKLAGKAQLSEAIQGRVYECWRTLERMLNLNTYNYIAQDYRYWDDPSDEFREQEGTLLPLWKLTYEKTRRHSITDFHFNPHYYDLFVASFGYFDFSKPISNGGVCLFTLKNPSFPDYICMTDSAAMCVDIHEKYPYMLLIGLYDGNVVVYNIQQSCQQPTYKSNPVTQKHGGIVREVKWAENMPDGEMNFHSVASDGLVNHWILMQSELAVTTIMNLYLETPAARGPDGTFVKKRACASCMQFHPTNKQIYLIGTEEGLIYKCSTAYTSSYLVTYKAHQLPIPRIDFNKLNSSLFASCSADWRIKIWEDMRLEPLYVFDLGTNVGDVKWAPYSSTVFGAVTIKGKAYIFDLNVSQHKPICEQVVVSRKKHRLTRIAFNYNLPIIVCGDDKGCIHTLKLSPNLRQPCKPTKKQQNLDQLTLQLLKLDNLLATSREPATISLPPDTAGDTES